MAAYAPEMWSELFVATAGAMAALAGLIFVAVTLNHEEVLASPGLPPLAARSVGTLLALVVMSTFGLAPGQDADVLGVELVVLGGVVTILLVASTLRASSPDDPARYAAVLTAISLISSLPMAIAGLSLLLGWGGGLYWVLAEILTALGASMYGAWVLLIEIRR